MWLKELINLFKRDLLDFIDEINKFLDGLSILAEYLWRFLALAEILFLCWPKTDPADFWPPHSK